MTIDVVYLLEHPTLLGGERSWLSTLPHLPGVKPLAVAPPYGPLADALRSAGIPLLPFPWPTGDPESRAGQLAPLLRDTPCDLVHANSLTTSLGASLLAEALGVPAVGHARDIMKLSLARVDRLNRLRKIVAVSRASSDALKAQGVREDLIEVRWNGIDARGEFDPAGVRDGLHDALGLPASTPVVGFVGQLVQRKDPLTFVRAARLLSREFPGARAVVVGARYSAKDEALEYEATVRAEAGDRVAFLGEREDVSRLLRGLSVLVNSSRQEPLGRVILEALALARPVVATDTGGTAEIVTHGETGLLVPVGDPEAVSSAILSLLRDPEKATEMGQRGRERILRDFTPEASAKGIMEVYRDVLGGQ